MWNRFNQPIAIVASAFVAASSLAMSDTAMAARQRNYTPIEMRSVLRGLGYNVVVKNGPLTDAATKKAIRDFQTHYDLSADGTVLTENSGSCSNHYGNSPGKLEFSSQAQSSP